MTVFIGFLVAVFVISSRREAAGRDFRTIWLLALTVVVAATFYSLRVIE